MTPYDTACELSTTAADLAAEIGDERACHACNGARARSLLDTLAAEIGDTGPDRPVPYTLTSKALAALPSVGAFPPVVCLCGSTRFYNEFRRANLRLTLAGQIVLSIGCDTKSDGDLAAADDFGPDPALVKARLDELHKRKIDLADYVLVINVGGYIGDSTRSEIAYAAAHGKPVRYLTGTAAEDTQ
jgi:hypothetical protein